jgi:hypothetical protein
MPELVRLYIRQVAIGFAIAAAFVVLLLWLNVGNLQHLIFNAPGGWLALFMLFFFNGLVFAGVQFAIAVMSMAERPDSGGGRRLRMPMADAFDAQPAAIVLQDESPARGRPRG